MKWKSLESFCAAFEIGINAVQFQRWPSQISSRRDNPHEMDRYTQHSQSKGISFPRWNGLPKLKAVGFKRRFSSYLCLQTFSTNATLISITGSWINCPYHISFRSHEMNEDAGKCEHFNQITKQQNFARAYVCVAFERGEDRRACVRH